MRSVEPLLVNDLDRDRYRVPRASDNNAEGARAKHTVHLQLIEIDHPHRALTLIREVTLDAVFLNL